MSGMIYLSSPFSHADPKVMELRYEQVCIAAAQLMEKGRHVYSPIAHSFGIAKFGNLPGDWSFWKEQDIWMLGHASEFDVLMLPGWEQSVGVAAELSIARDLLLPVAWWQFDGISKKIVEVKRRARKSTPSKRLQLPWVILNQQRKTPKCSMYS